MLYQHKLDLEERLKEYHEFNSTFISDNDKDGSSDDGKEDVGKTDSEECEDTNTCMKNGGCQGDADISDDCNTHPEHSEHTSTKCSTSEDITAVAVETKDTQNSSQSTPQKFSRQRPGSVMLRSLIFHIPEMNLPWHPMRSVSQCSCGTAFGFTQRKVLACC